jgi:hypothetical protein
MEWIPVVLVTFKLLVFCTGMFFAIKWHYDQGRKKNKQSGSVSQAAVPGARPSNRG